jgi:lysophospholipase L1-like esterase
MKLLFTILAGAALLSASPLFSADDASNPSNVPVPKPPDQPATGRVFSPPQHADIAAPKLGDDGEIQHQFAILHAGCIAVGQKRMPEVVFLGDSITLGWSINGKEVFKEFAKYNVANFGIFGDQVQHVLWRVDNGEFDAITPKVVVLMIGTNNAPAKQHSPEEIASGIRKIIDAIHSKSPETKILLLAIFPRGAYPDDKNRQKNEEVNAIIAKYDDGKTVHFLNINDKLLQPDGALDATIMPDFLHPSEAGYRIVAEAIRGKLDSLVK